MQWDTPVVTLACLVLLTVVIGFLHEYILPLSILILLGVTAWEHPHCRKWRQHAAELRRRRRFRPPARGWLGRCCGSRLTARQRLSLASRLLGCICFWRQAGPTEEGEEAKLSPQSSFSGEGASVAGDGAALPPLVKERWENERRLVFGRFTSQRLRFYDPPPWCDTQGCITPTTPVSCISSLDMFETLVSRL